MEYFRGFKIIDGFVAVWGLVFCHGITSFIAKPQAQIQTGYVFQGFHHSYCDQTVCFNIFMGFTSNILQDSLQGVQGSHSEVAVEDAKL